MLLEAKSMQLMNFVRECLGYLNCFQNTLKRTSEISINSANL